MTKPAGTPGGLVLFSPAQPRPTWLHRGAATNADLARTRHLAILTPLQSDPGIATSTGARPGRRTGSTRRNPASAPFPDPRGANDYGDRRNLHRCLRRHRLGAPLRINKSAVALIGAGLLWTVYALTSGDPARSAEQLDESLASTAQIVFFLMGAMTIVEVVDAHNGFEVITSRIRTTKLSTLMWLVGFVTFFLSAMLDNLTTTIVMISLMKKLLGRTERPAVLCRDDRDRRQCRRRLVPDRRRHHHHALDRRPDHAAGDHEGGVPGLAGQPGGAAVVVSYGAAAAAGRRARRSRWSRAETDPPLRAQSDVLPGARHPGPGAGLQDRDPSAAVHGHPVRPRHPVAGRRTDPPRQGRRGQGASDPGARPDADRHELDRVLHRHPARGGDPGAHPYPRSAGPVARPRRSAART